ncbi:MAG: hypothetical protein IJA55_08595 [Clostridia bacterium]|nr:hypothetical protein [Clostridia bacterium]
MKREKLQDAVGMIGDDLIEEAASYKKKRNRLRWIPAVAILLCISILMGVVALRPKEESMPETPIDQNLPETPIDQNLLTDNAGDDAEVNEQESATDISGNKHYYNLDYCMKKAVYPERVLNYSLNADLNDPEAYNKWQNDRDSFREAYDSDTPDLSKFIKYSTKAFLADTEDNAIYSPVNVYMALAMLAETSAGESRAQILNALGSDSIDELRADANSLWKALYTDDGTAKTILANSLWLREEGEYKSEPLEILAENYYASTFEGRMGSKEYDEVLRGWLNEQTDGMLTDQVKGIGLPEETVLALASTILFNGKWSEEFNPERNRERVFHGTDGKVTTEFMNESTNGSISVGDNFTAYKKYFTENGHMTFILPKEGMTPQELIATDEFAEFVLCGGRDSYMSDLTDKPCWDSERRAIINFSMPKFDVSSQLDLTEDLGKLGITDITDEIKANMSPITDAGAFLDTMVHGARVTVDEKGCKAAAFTMMICGATSAPLDEINFVLDRPFVFVIGGYDGLPLFIGTVNNVK